MDNYKTIMLIATLACLFGPITAQQWSYQPIGDGWQSDSTAMEMEENDHPDSRFIKYTKLLADGGRRFRDLGLVSFVQLVVDEDEDRQQLIVGGRNALYRLNLTTLEPLEKVDWEPDKSDTQNCRKIWTKEACYNFIRVLLVQKGEHETLHHDSAHHGDVEAAVKPAKVFACGTHAFNPKCRTASITNLTTVIQEYEGNGKCPYSPDYNATSLLTDDGNLYSATVVDRHARDPAVIRQHLDPEKSKPLRTLMHDTHWLNEPNFVSTYEIDDFVYFFFRETAVEYINCGKRIYSRVARVCKTDKGDASQAHQWSSFHKARLNCSLPGHFPFYFDELQSTFYSEDENVIYGVFTTPGNSIAGSAVCVYNMTNIQEAFDGPFKVQADSSSIWLPKDNDDVNDPKKKCQSSSGSSKSTRDAKEDTKPTVMWWKKKEPRQLMDQAVASYELGPLIMRENERWTHIVVDEVYTRIAHYSVLFLATEDGRVRKMVRIPDSNKTCLVEEIKIVENGHPRPVQSMKISQAEKAIYISTEGEILKIPVQRCGRHKTLDRCNKAQDPYCGWDSRVRVCAPAPGGNFHDPNWEQHFHTCPQLDYMVNGSWSGWSHWESCGTQGEDEVADSCLCRSRTCDKPKPLNNGAYCRGESMQVTNCTVHGNFTEWSQWSGCSATCGYALKTRTRHCGNPPPKHGGRNCEGTTEQTEHCKLGACPLPAVQRFWQAWSGWTACTRPCNSGIQTRKRKCSQHYRAKGECAGNTEEWRMCNTYKCPEITKISPWSQWISTNQTTRGHVRQRFRFKCRSNVETSKDIKMEFAKTQVEMCVKGQRSSCHRPRDMAAAITNIDTFTSVDRALKKYCRQRRRLFKKYCKCRSLGVFLVCQKCGMG